MILPPSLYSVPPKRFFPIFLPTPHSLIPPYGPRPHPRPSHEPPLYMGPARPPGGAVVVGGVQYTQYALLFK